jgi:hypothetical protein
MALSLVDSAILKINKWCFRQLENYHSYFNKVGHLHCLDHSFFSAVFFSFPSTKGSLFVLWLLIEKAINEY